MATLPPTPQLASTIQILDHQHGVFTRAVVAVARDQRPAAVVELRDLASHGGVALLSNGLAEDVAHVGIGCGGVG